MENVPIGCLRVGFVSYPEYRAFLFVASTLVVLALSRTDFGRFIDSIAKAR